MSSLNQSVNKKRLLRLVFLVAAVLLAVILIRACADRKTDLSSLGSRQDYLHELGWEIDPDSEEHKTVRIPESLDGIIENYNEMQLEQGFDLSEHLGEKCEQYSYTVLNYPDPSQTVQITLYIQGNTLIAGDVHSTAMDGFMQGLTRE